MDNNNVNNNNMKYKTIDGMVWSNEIENWIPFTDWLEFQAQELQQKTQQMALDFEAKIKEMALKYNTQLDTAKIKADADLDKMMMAGENKILEQATKSTNMFSQQVQGLNGNQRPGEEIGRNQPIQPSQTNTRE